MQQPVWIYSVGTAICSTRINLPDTATLDDNHKIESDCFYSDVKHARALGYHSHADFIFYSDISDQTVTRLRVFEGRKSVEKEPITANVPAVKGNYVFICLHDFIACFITKIIVIIIFSELSTLTKVAFQYSVSIKKNTQIRGQYATG